MKINKVTITGADNKVCQIELLKLSDSYPFVEWGILFSKSKSGTQRYPDKAWIDFLLELGLDLSAHFCGWYSKAILESGDFDLISRLDPQFKRVQLNYNFDNSNRWSLSELPQYCLLNPERAIILQYNKNNADHLDKFKLQELPSNIHFLYDDSGGNATNIDEIKARHKNHYTGYAGGINVDNITTICRVIKNIDRERLIIDPVWIDLESGARSKNEFDINKVGLILSKCASHVEIKF